MDLKPDKFNEIAPLIIPIIFIYRSKRFLINFDSAIDPECSENFSTAKGEKAEIQASPTVVDPQENPIDHQPKHNKKRIARFLSGIHRQSVYLIDN